MASNLRVDTILPSTGTTLGIGTASGTINFLGNSNIVTTGNVSIGGTLTYEDVTNVDSVGVITARSTIDAQGDVSIADKIIHTGDTNTAIRFPAADTVTMETGGSERLRITSNGRLGIGQASPEALLHIEASSSGASYTADAADTLILERNGGCVIDFRTPAANDGGLVFSDNSARAQGTLLYNHSDNSLRFGTNGAERLRIDANGYLVKASGLTCAFNVKGTNMSRTDASGYVCDFDNDTSSGCFDSGNNFNTSTNEFTAPVSGYYYFFTNIRLDSFNSGYIRTAILSTSYHAGTVYYAIPSTGHVITYADNGSIQTVQTSTVMYLPATHKAWVYQDPSSDTSYTCYLNESSFGGYFIG